MATLTILQQPGRHMAGYSPIPFKVHTDNTESLNYKITTTILYNETSSTASQVVSVNNSLVTKLTIDNDYRLGDLVYVENPTYYGYYTIMDRDATFIIINLNQNALLPNIVNVFNFIKFKNTPDIDGNIEMNIQDVIKDYVTQNKDFVADSFLGTNTSFEYKIHFGEEYDYAFNFIDNGFSGSTGTVFFYTGLPDPGTDFQVGDSVNVAQQDSNITITGAADNGGLVKLFMSTLHNYAPGQVVNISGSSIAAYNGLKTVALVSTTNSLELTINEVYAGSTTGLVYGIPVPEYNGIATIVNIFHDVLGTILELNIPWAGSTQPIPGTITYTNNKKSITFYKANITTRRVYNAISDNWNISNMTAYTLGEYNPTKFSSMLPSVSTINRTAKGYLLIHSSDESYLTNTQYSFYTEGGILLGTTELDNTTYGTGKDLYIPYTLNEISLGSTSNNILSYVDDITYYTMSIDNTGGTRYTETLTFNVSNDCSEYDIKHLMYKDSYGSYLSFPFIFKSYDSVEVDKKSYYKNEGSFTSGANNTFEIKDTDRGEIVYMSQSRETMTLNSGWLERDEYERFKDLITSTDVYLTDESGNVTPVILSVKKANIKKFDNGELISHTVTLRLSKNNTKY